MDIVFIYRVIISFLVAGFWIAFATLLAERLGSKIGGLIANLPSHLLISLFFLAVVNGTPFVIDAITGIPVGMAISTLFLFVFIVFLKYGLMISTFVSLIAWCLSAILLVSMKLENIVLNIFLYLLITIVSYVVLEKFIKIPSIEKSRKEYTKYQIIVRAFSAGSVVASVIIISKFLSPYAVGIFATFPAVFLSTMIVLVLNQSKAFAQATG
ncbi:MAG: DUF3147 family protein, partial [Methanolobus sp.]|nr:DUF3147 family protein [Methanolobus sp.]